MRLKFLAALAALVALAIAGCGSNGDPSSNDDARPAGNGADRAFVAGMLPHHQSAVEMAKIAQQRGETRFVTQLADDIVRTQSAEITTMRAQDRELAAAGIKPGSLGVAEHMMGMEDDPATLRDARPFDREFLTMMIPHHEGAVNMAKAELANGSDPELKQLAQMIIDAQQREISEMRAQLGEDSGDTETDSQRPSR